jgi:hypothetical protein
MDTHKLQQKQQDKATSRLHELFEQCRAIERAEKQEADEHKHQTILSTVRNFKSTLVHTLEQLTKATSEHKAALHNHVQHEREHRKKRLLLAEHENLARRQEAALGVKNEKLERSRQRVCGRALERTERRRIIEQNRALSCSPSLFMPLPAINALLRRGTFATTVQQCREEESHLSPAIASSGALGMSQSVNRRLEASFVSSVSTRTALSPVVTLASVGISTVDDDDN